LLAACGVTAGPDDAPRSEEPRGFRWVPGLAASTLTETARVPVEERLGPPPPGCYTGDLTALTVVADVAPAAGAETILASSAHGVVVIGGDDEPLGAVAFPCGGSGDEVVALAVGDAGVGAPVIAVVVTTGGRAETTTRIELLGFRGDRLVRLFAGPIETRDGDAIASGQLRVTERGLVHRRPDGRITVWQADPWTRAYVEAP
jgi:hypothetical protein